MTFTKLIKSSSFVHTLFIPLVPKFKKQEMKRNESEESKEQKGEKKIMLLSWKKMKRKLFILLFISKSE